MELAGAFLLSAEAIGLDNLQAISTRLKKKRLASFAILVIVVIAIATLAKAFQILHLVEALILILSLGIIYDFAPRLIDTILKRQQKGTLGIVGFVLFSIGFTIQAYVTLTLLY